MRIEDCLEGATWYRDRLNELMDFLKDKRGLSAAEERQAQEKLRTIKDRFKGDRKTAASVRKCAAMTDVEREYHRVVADAATRIHVKWNSHPLRSRWYDELYDCGGDFDFYLRHHIGSQT